MQIIDGNALARQIKDEIRDAVSAITKSGRRAPHLAAVLVGDDPASRSYVTNKVKSCFEVGFKSTLIQQPSEITQPELISIIRDLNANAEVDGFIVQLPLPRHIDETAVTLEIDPAKDVDGFHPMNIGKMTLGMPAYLPATPMGIIEMLKRYRIDITGKQCCVIGRSNIVGTPISILLSRKGNPGNATVVMCHSHTQQLKDITLASDVIIVALGKANYLTADMVREGTVVIDVGINRIKDTNKKSGFRLTGDVDYSRVAPKCSFITPVPGGVGPMTVTSLMMNTLKAYNGDIYPVPA